jgi:hypothetical protein
VRLQDASPRINVAIGGYIADARMLLVPAATVNRRNSGEFPSVRFSFSFCHVPKLYKGFIISSSLSSIVFEDGFLRVSRLR